MKVKTIEVKRIFVESFEDVGREPKFKIKQYVEIYSGSLYAAHRFYIKDIRYNKDTREFEYLYDAILMGGWYPERCIVPA